MRNKIRGIKGFYHGPSKDDNPKSLNKYRSVDPINSQATISPSTPEDSAWQQFKTFVTNPFDGARALVNDARTSVRESVGLNNDNITSGPYANLSSLRRANLSEDEETIQALSRSSVLNSASSMFPPALTAQTASDALSGDVTALATKKLNKIPGVKQLLKNPEKVAKAGYTFYKTNSNLNKT
tara:strand:+ start:320 stop:868 length:549 start_codon:yes stop_codon:yes gene_type:complete